MPRRTNAELSAATHAALLKRARVAFARHGFGGTSVDELARAVDLTKGAVYHHFGSKEGLFIAVVREIDAEIAARIRAALPAADASRAQFLAACRLFLEATLDDDVRRILLIDCPAVLGHRTTRELDAETSITPLVEALSGLRASGEIGSIDAEAAAHLISGALYEAALWIGESREPAATLARAMDTFTRLIGVLAPRQRARR